MHWSAMMVLAAEGNMTEGQGGLQKVGLSKKLPLPGGAGRGRAGGSLGELRLLHAYVSAGARRVPQQHSGGLAGAGLSRTLRSLSHTASTPGVVDVVKQVVVSKPPKDVAGNYRGHAGAPLQHALGKQIVEPLCPKQQPGKNRQCQHGKECVVRGASIQHLCLAELCSSHFCC